MAVRVVGRRAGAQARCGAGVGTGAARRAPSWRRRGEYRRQLCREARRVSDAQARWVCACVPRLVPPTGSSVAASCTCGTRVLCPRARAASSGARSTQRKSALHIRFLLNRLVATSCALRHRAGLTPDVPPLTTWSHGTAWVQGATNHSTTLQCAPRPLLRCRCRFSVLRVAVPAVVPSLFTSTLVVTPLVLARLY